MCWYQRILMYPLALLLIVGLLRRDRHLAYLVLPFSLIGQGVSTYHYSDPEDDHLRGAGRRVATAFPVPRRGSTGSASSRFPYHDRL
ncbi:MAG: hypothetical protein R2856_01085 [Caldilineaceae bacterium]